MSTPSRKILPLSGRYKPDSSRISVDFPEPIGPTMAMRSPLSIVIVTGCNAVSLSLKAKVTCSSRTAPLQDDGMIALPMPGWSIGSRIISSRPCSASLACCHCVTQLAICVIGDRARLLRMEQAMSAPMEICPALTIHAPSPMMAT